MANEHIHYQRLYANFVFLFKRQPRRNELQALRKAARHNSSCDLSIEIEGPSEKAQYAAIGLDYQKYREVEEQGFKVDIFFTFFFVTIALGLGIFVFVKMVLLK